MIDQQKARKVLAVSEETLSIAKTALEFLASILIALTIVLIPNAVVWVVPNLIQNDAGLPLDFFITSVKVVSLVIGFLVLA